MKIRELKIRKKEVKIELHKYGNTKHAVRLKFDDEHYTAAQFQSQFDVIFAKSEAELSGSEKTAASTPGS